MFLSKPKKDIHLTFCFRAAPSLRQHGRACNERSHHRRPGASSLEVRQRFFRLTLEESGSPSAVCAAPRFGLFWMERL